MPSPPPVDVQAARLTHFFERHPRCFVLTGAGCSTESGIPAYRDETGQLRHRSPITFQEFVGDEERRRHYWARSLVGYPRVRAAEPGPSHRALRELERLGRVGLLVTQNVDGLHQAAGSTAAVCLHGNLSEVRCLGCGDISCRDALQRRLVESNPDFEHHSPHLAPDGDAALDETLLSRFVVASCQHCRGMLKPNVVFFGEAVPGALVQHAYEELSRSDALMVVGSSLTVFSGYRFAKRALSLGLPIAIVNHGFCRAAPMAELTLPGPSGEVLPRAVRALPSAGDAPCRSRRGSGTETPTNDH